mmetsp:Transcript_68084/g.121282  ORF Transcript_68084/g.121282 Transcript_68084/m.121282 type:complete len:236 (-) Transcript_68084:193-900(-)
MQGLSRRGCSERRISMGKQSVLPGDSLKRSQCPPLQAFLLGCLPVHMPSKAQHRLRARSRREAAGADSRMQRVSSWISVQRQRSQFHIGHPWRLIRTDVCCRWLVALTQCGMCTRANMGRSARICSAGAITARLSGGVPATVPGCSVASRTMAAAHRVCMLTCLRSAKCSHWIFYVRVICQRSCRSLRRGPWMSVPDMCALSYSALRQQVCRRICSCASAGSCQCFTSSASLTRR